MATGRKAILALAVLAACCLSVSVSRALTSPYVRPKPRTTISELKSLLDDAHGQTPQQVRFTNAPAYHVPPQLHF
jgi:hypothetical protein